jgi:hypothetical protein
VKNTPGLLINLVVHSASVINSDRAFFVLELKRDNLNIVAKKLKMTSGVLMHEKET